MNEKHERGERLDDGDESDDGGRAKIVNRPGRATVAKLSRTSASRLDSAMRRCGSACTS